jgi:hypothetical protein
VAAEVEGNGAVARGNEAFAEEAIFLLEIAQTGQHDHEGAGAYVGVGKVAFGALQDIADRGNGAGCGVHWCLLLFIANELMQLAIGVK